MRISQILGGSALSEWSNPGMSKMAYATGVFLLIAIGGCSSSFPNQAPASTSIRRMRNIFNT